jgi:hypothetical protein
MGFGVGGQRVTHPTFPQRLSTMDAIDFWRQHIVTQNEVFFCSQNNTDFVLASVVLIVTRKDISL